MLLPSGTDAWFPPILGVCVVFLAYPYSFGGPEWPCPGTSHYLFIQYPEGVKLWERRFLSQAASALTGTCQILTLPGREGDQ